jgi:hypothetical protein
VPAGDSSERCKEARSWRSQESNSGVRREQRKEAREAKGKESFKGASRCVRC